MTQEQMRADFETWAKKEGIDTHRDGPGYFFVEAESAWKGYQAAFASQPKAEQLTAELLAMNRQLREQNEALDKRCAEYEEVDQELLESMRVNRVELTDQQKAPQ